jgi:magnesium chelatase family protein
MDRFDLRVRVARLEADELVGPPGESSEQVRCRVDGARRRQLARGMLNRALSRSHLDAMTWGAGALARLEQSVARVALTARGWDRVRRVAVTIADLADAGEVGESHVAEALAYRGME